MGYLYERSSDNRYRFLLGTQGTNPIICFGINPSTAEPGNLDSTMKKVEAFSKSWGYDSYFMLNIYPQRATDPNDLDKECNHEMHQQNLKVIEELFRTTKAPVWAAWGNLISKRPYLKDCLKDIHSLVQKHRLQWYHLGVLTKSGNPRHPLYLKQGLLLKEFEIHE